MSSHMDRDGFCLYGIVVLVLMSGRACYVVTAQLARQMSVGSG